MRMLIPKIITWDFLFKHPNYRFVFGDNIIHTGLRGAAKLRTNPQAIGFVTKKYPNNKNNSFYNPTDYKEIFDKELIKLERVIKDNTDLTFLISKLGAGLANRFYIREIIIEPGIKILEKYKNVIFLK